MRRRLADLRFTPETFLAGIRVAVSALLAVHGWTRLIIGGIPVFGAWLDSQGVPFGTAVAAFVTFYEIVGTALLAWNWRVAWLTPVFCAIYATGIVMVHAPYGWFVVGKGRNGVEYSVLLIACLVCLGLNDASARRRGRELRGAG